MKKSNKIYTTIHNAIAIIITIISFMFLIKNATPEGMLNAIVWSIISGITYRMVFDLKVIHFYIGALFSTVILFLFEWWYIPFIYILNQFIYRSSCLIVRDGSKTGERPLAREVFIVLNLVNTGVLISFIKMYFIPNMQVDLSTNLLAMIIVCIIESFIGLIFIYLDLKQQDKISSIPMSIAMHLKETYGIYAVYICMVINIVIMYQDNGYVGLAIASSYIFALRLAFDKQAKANQIEAESYTDVLTGVKNKKYYIESLPEEFTSSCAIFFIDFNGFKGINDKYGHDVGDDIIILGGEILSKAVREKDDVIRFGGDEFMLLISDADRDVCREVIKRIENLCEEMTYKKGEIEIKISMAIGIAICPEESNLKDELATIADEKMYKAKENKTKFNLVYEM